MIAAYLLKNGLPDGVLGEYKQDTVLCQVESRWETAYRLPKNPITTIPQDIIQVWLLLDAMSFSTVLARVFVPAGAW